MTLPPRTALRCVFRVAAGPRIGFGHLLRARDFPGCGRLKTAVNLRIRIGPWPR
jgi:hypothetical protein